jgi:glutaredoxin
MFETLKKKKARLPKSKHVGSKNACGACGYVRKESDINPAWQCPSCKAAYVKTEKAHKKYSQVELKRKNTEYQSEKIRKSKMSAITSGLKGLWFGVAALVSGAGSACSGAASNPFLQVIGAVVVIGSIAYILLESFGG